MLEALVITLREGVEAALVVGIILAYLHKTGKVDLNRMVYWGLGAAILASVAFAIVLQALNIDPENEYIEGALFGAAGIMVASLVVWMWRVSKKLKAEVEKKLGTIVGQANIRAQGLGLLTFTFVMVFREGAETVLFLTGATLGKFDFLSFIGGSIGIGLAVLFAIFFIRGSLKMNLSRFFGVTSIVLLILAFKLLLGSLHEFAEVGAIPLTPVVMAVIGFFVRDNTSTIILMALLVAPLMVILWDARSRGVLPNVATEHAVERRKLLAARRQEGIWRSSLVMATLVILFATGWMALTGSSFTDIEPIPVNAAGGQVRIPVAGLKEGQMTKYVYSIDGTNVRFLVVLNTDGSIATALDACQICGPKGYGQEGDKAICKNCNAPIVMDTIGQGGGCNPLPLGASLDTGSVVIAVEELVQASPIFR
ncbi:MAG: DUF2318 domain-containing protein [Chloroflexi bacterium]|nr:DUF2318 domain-containing protein [Chloroflexota bacterium]